MWVYNYGYLLFTPLITTHEPPSKPDPFEDWQRHQQEAGLQDLSRDPQAPFLSRTLLGGSWVVMSGVISPVVWVNYGYPTF